MYKKKGRGQQKGCGREQSAGLNFESCMKIVLESLNFFWLTQGPQKFSQEDLFLSTYLDVNNFVK